MRTFYRVGPERSDYGAKDRLIVRILKRDGSRVLGLADNFIGIILLFAFRDKTNQRLVKLLGWDPPFH